MALVTEKARAGAATCTDPARVILEKHLSTCQSHLLARHSLREGGLLRLARLHIQLCFQNLQCCLFQFRSLTTPFVLLSESISMPVGYDKRRLAPALAADLC